MGRPVISFPRSKERPTNLLRNILGDVVAIATTIEEIFDEGSPEQLDEMNADLDSSKPR